MDDIKRPSLRFLMFGIGALLLSPLIIFIVPLMAVESFYFDKENIMLITPKVNFVLAGVGMVLIVGSFFLLAWKRKTITYAVVTLCIILACISLVTSTKSFTAIHPNGIIMQKYGDQILYKWDDMKSAVYELENSSEPARYIFTMQDGRVIELIENGQIQRVKGNIYGQLSSRKIFLTELDRDEVSN